MWDYFKHLGNSLGGDHADHAEARKLTLSFIILGLMFLGFTTFAAFLSWQRYAALLGALPGAREVGLIISILFALGVMSCTGYVAAFIISRTLGQAPHPGSPAGFVLFTVLGLVLVSADYNMNLAGVADVAPMMAGSTASARDSEIMQEYDNLMAPHRASVAALDKHVGNKGHVCNGGCELFSVSGQRGNPHWQGVLTKYGRAAKDYHQEQIRNLTAQRDEAIAADRAQVAEVNTAHAERLTTTSNHLRLAAQWVYGVNMFIALLLAYCGERMEEAASIRGKKSGRKHSVVRRREEDQEEDEEEEDDEVESEGPDPLPHPAPKPVPSTQAYKQTRIGFRTDADVRNQNPQSVPENSGRFRHLPSRQGGLRVDALEARGAILSAVRTLRDCGERPVQRRIAEITGYTERTVGKHVRELRREGLL